MVQVMPDQNKTDWIPALLLGPISLVFSLVFGVIC